MVIGVQPTIPATVTVAEAAALLGVSRSAAYRAVEAYLSGDREAWPCHVIRVGGRLLIPAAPLYAALGLPLPDAPSAA